MTKQEALEYVRRYKEVNEFEIAELRSTSIEVKLKQTAALMASVHQMGWAGALGNDDADDAEVRERWRRLRKAYRCG